MASAVLAFLGFRVGGVEQLAGWLLRFTVQGSEPAAVLGFSWWDFLHLPAEAVVSAFCSTKPLVNRLIPRPVVLPCGTGRKKEAARASAVGGVSPHVLGMAPEIVGGVAPQVLDMAPEDDGCSDWLSGNALRAAGC
jgi:hypothetical protein